MAKNNTNSANTGTSLGNSGNGVGSRNVAAPLSPPQAAKPAASLREVKPNPEQVRKRAFEIYQERVTRNVHGDSAADWAQAERELAGR